MKTVNVNLKARWAFVMLGLTWLASAVQAGIDDGLIAYYSFDGSEAGWDCAGQNHDAKVMGATDLAPGKRGDGFAFSGKNILQADSFSGFNWGANITISAWFYWSGSSPPNGFILFAGPADAASFGIKMNESPFGPGLNVGSRTEKMNTFSWHFPTIPVKTNEWNHIAYTYDGIRSVLYWNGSRIDANISGSGSIIPQDFPLVIGDQFNGIIDELRMYNRVLSDDEIRALRRDEPGQPPAECRRPQVLPDADQKDETPTISQERREAAQLEALCCKVLDNWVEMLRREERAVLEAAFTRTSRRTLVWDSLIDLQDPAKALPDDQVPEIQNPPVDGPCLTAITTILRIWKSGEKFFAFAELEKLLNKKKEWELQSR